MDGGHIILPLLTITEYNYAYQEYILSHLHQMLNQHKQD